MAKETSPDTKHQQITIETPRLILRAARISDVDDLFECFSNEDVMRYWDTLPHPSTEVTKKWVEGMINGDHNGVTDFVICAKPTITTNTGSDPGLNDTVHDEHVGNDGTGKTHDGTKVIGKVGVWHDSEVGFLLHRAYWGQGLASEAVREVLDLAFDVVPHPTNSSSTEEGLREDVVADVDPGNEASLGLLKKLGFEVYARKERTFEVGDVWVDSVYLSLKRGTWIERRGDVG